MWLGAIDGPGLRAAAPARRVAWLVTVHPDGIAEMLRIAESSAGEPDSKIRSMCGTADLGEDAAAPEAPGQSVAKNKKRPPLLIRQALRKVGGSADR